MVNTALCQWLLENGNVTTRYRVYRELLGGEKEAGKLEKELFENKGVIKWLKNLKPETPPQHRSMHHGMFDFCLENALPKAVQLGLHAGIEQMRDAVGFYFQSIKDCMEHNTEKGILYRQDLTGFSMILGANFLISSGFTDEFITDFLLKSLDEMYSFVKLKDYDIYISDEERSKLPGVPKNWVSAKFIKPELLEYGFCYPLIYDLIGMYKLYELKNPEIDNKLDEIIGYISSDEFHSKIESGYGIIIEPEMIPGRANYHGMGWDPKYPGWFDIREYIETADISRTSSMPRLLFFAQYISKYPAARRTKWFNELLDCLESYITDSGTYLFPGGWLKEQSGYAVGGNHISFGENRRKKNWAEIESTLYMQLLWLNI